MKIVWSIFSPSRTKYSTLTSDCRKDKKYLLGYRRSNEKHTFFRTESGEDRIPFIFVAPLRDSRKLCKTEKKAYVIKMTNTPSETVLFSILRCFDNRRHKLTEPTLNALLIPLAAVQILIGTKHKLSDPRYGKLPGSWNCRFQSIRPRYTHHLRTHRLELRAKYRYVLKIVY